MSITGAVAGVRSRERQQATSVQMVSRNHLARYMFAALYCRGVVLDAACGVGYGSCLLQSLGCQMLGIDIDKDTIKTASEYYTGPQYVCGDVCELNLALRFDWVVSFETIEHLPDPTPALKSFRQCSPRLICSVPNELVLPFRAEDFAGDQYPHQRHYTPDEFEGLLRSTGWNTIERHCQQSKKNPEVIPGDAGAYLVYACT